MLLACVFATSHLIPHAKTLLGWCFPLLSYAHSTEGLERPIPKISLTVAICLFWCLVAIESSLHRSLKCAVSFPSEPQVPIIIGFCHQGYCANPIGQNLRVFPVAQHLPPANGLKTSRLVIPSYPFDLAPFCSRQSFIVRIWSFAGVTWGLLSVVALWTVLVSRIFRFCVCRSCITSANALLCRMSFS